MLNNWTKNILGDLIDVKHGYAFKGEFFSETPTRDILLSPGNFHIGGGFKADKFKYYNGIIPNDYVLKEDDLLITMTDLSPKGDTLGTTALIPKHNEINYLHNQRLGLVIFKSNKIFNKYLYWALRHDNYHNFIVSSATGSTVKHTSPSRIKEYEINLPPLSEQLAIAEILSSLDDKIELNLQTNKTLEEMANALYKHWFVDFGPFKDGKFIDTELGLIPEGWEVKLISENGEVITGKTPSTNSPELFGDSIPFVTPTDFKDYGRHSFSASRGLSQLGINDFKTKILSTNSILVTCIGSDMGKIVLSKKDCLTNQQINSIKVNKEKCSYLFLYLFFVSKYEDLRMMAGNGTTMPIINKTDFEKIKIIIPPISIMNEFHSLIEMHDEIMFLNSKENKSLKQTRDYLLPKLISGEIQVEVATKKVKVIL